MLPSKPLLLLMLCLLPLNAAQALWHEPAPTFDLQDAQVAEAAIELGQSPDTQRADASANGKKSFAEALQWRILNILAQQVFETAMLDFSPGIFDTAWHYKTSTFEVEIQSDKTRFIVVKISDYSGQANPTVLEIPTYE